MNKKTFMVGAFNVILLFFVTTTLAMAGLSLKIVDINNEPVENIIVYMYPLDNQVISNQKSKPLVIKQLDKKFSPSISVIKKGEPLSFVNEDEITHHIYSALSTNRFSFRLKKGEEKKITGLVATGKILMGCNIHDWMSGYLFVLDTSMYAKTNYNGESHIEVKEKGRYRLVLWHPQMGEKNQMLSQEIVFNKNKFIRIKLTKKMSPTSIQENPESFDFLDGY